MMFEKSYYLEPDSKSPKAYVLLRRALEDTDRVAIVQFALREKTRLGALRIRDDVLVLQSLLWADEVREASFPALETSIRISAQEREMSAALVDSMASDFEPDQFTDDYQEQLRQLIEAKLEKGESLDTEETFGVEPAEAGKGEVIDLMEALKRSIEKKRGGRAGGDVRPGTPRLGGEGRRRGPAAKTAAKPASKTTAPRPRPPRRLQPRLRPPRLLPSGRQDCHKTAASKTAAKRPPPRRRERVPEPGCRPAAVVHA